MGTDDLVRHDLPWAPGRAVRHLSTLASTQTALREWAANGAPHGAVVLADRQTAGRGRQSRSWCDAGEGNLFVSVLLRHLHPLEGLPAFSPLVAWTVREAAGPLSGMTLKWPNDLWIEEKKVAGVLLESVGADGPTVLVGVGLNLREPASGWGELEGVATSLEAEGYLIAPTGFLSRWLPELERAWRRFVVDGLSPYLDSWNESSALAGRTVRWEENGERRRGTARSLQADGALQVELDSGEVRALHAGDVHLVGERA